MFKWKRRVMMLWRSPPKPIWSDCSTCGPWDGNTKCAPALWDLERSRSIAPWVSSGTVGCDATGKRAGCTAVNHLLKSRLPNTWTSIAVLFKPRMGLHRDIQNMAGHLNHALALGNYAGGRVWIEDDERDSAAWLATKKGERELRGFDARRYHMVEPHEGNMWALAAYVPRAYGRATEQHQIALREAGFPLPPPGTECRETKRQ